MNLGGGTVRVNKCAVLIIVSVLFLLFLYNYQGKEEDYKFHKSPLLKEKDASASGVVDTNIISLKKILSAAVDVAERGGLEVVKVRTGDAGSSANLGEQTKG